MPRPAGRLPLAGVFLLAACSRDPEIQERRVVVYSPRACPVNQVEAFSVVYAGGDFEPAADKPPVSSFFLRDVGRPASELPKDTRSLIVDVSQGNATWRGISEVASEGDVNVLVWPGSLPCSLSREVERRTDLSFGVAGNRLVVAGGRSPDGASVPHTYVGDLATGIIDRLDFGLNLRRSNATITTFGGGALVAGGHDPDSGPSDALRPIATAEVYRPGQSASGEFDQQRIDLSEPRTRHAAVALANGETLLVGGRGSSGLLRTMEIVDPATRRARTAGVALLRVPRERPTALRLANGEILVAGGTDAAGNPVPTLEWFSPDASRATKRTVDLVTGRERAFVALSAGGALAVIRPETNVAGFKTVWVISADGTLEAGTPVEASELDVVRIFSGADGAPALWTGRRWLRWSPWLGAFEALANAPTTGPSLDAIANGDSGLALWLEDRPAAGLFVNGFRFATRSRYAAIPKPLLTTTTAQLAPDRLAGTPASSLQFDAERGLRLGAGASAFLTDVTFADFDLSLDVTAASPVVVIRPESGAELEVGGAACAFAVGASKTLAVRRRGRRVNVTIDTAPERSCPTELEAGARVAVGLRGSLVASESGAKNLVVTRR